MTDAENLLIMRYCKKVRDTWRTDIQGIELVY